MPFSTEITNIKSEINSGLAASQYTAKDLVYVSKAIEALANAEVTQGLFDEATVTTILYVGANANNFKDTGSLTDPIAVFSKAGGANSFAQIAFRNETSTSSTDIIAYSNNGDDTTGWVSMGITGSAFGDPNFTLTGANDAYIFYEAAAGTDGKGNLILATGDQGSENKIIFAAGGFASGNEQVTIIPDQRVHIEIPTPSTSPSTGALTVVGGVGIQGDVNIQGNISFAGTGTTLSTSNITVSDPQVRVGSGNTTDAVDLGVVGEYQISGVTKYTGVVRDATDGVIKFFKDTTVAPSNGVVNFSGAGLAYSDIRIAGLTASSATITSATIGSVTNTEIGYLSGTTSTIQTQLNAKAEYPTQTGNSGSFLTTNGTSASWATISQVPSQTGNSGNFLTTNGTTASWAAVYPSQTGNSGKYLTTNGSVTSWATVDALPSQTNNSGKYLTTNGTTASWATITTDPLPDVFMMMGA